ncbi:MAK10-like protein [Tanacetum coccineum]
MKLEKALLDFDSNQEKRLSYLRTQLKLQQDDLIGKINLLWKTVSEKLNDTSSPENAGSFMAPRSITTISHDEKEELRKKGIKSPSKLLSQKYLSPASIKELNKNPSSPKRDHFINLIVILSTDSDTEEEDASSTNACNLDLGGMAKGKEELKEQGKEEKEMKADMEVEEEESEFETDEEVEEIIKEDEDDGDSEYFNSFPTMMELTHHEWLLKNPRPPWVPTRDELTYHRYLMSDPIPSIFLRNPIFTEGCPYNLKIPCNIGQVHIEKAYIDLNSPLNIMTRMMYNRTIRRKLNPREDENGGISNFTGRIKGMHVFVGNFTYVINFMIVEDISLILDARLSQLILGRPFIEISNMTHDLLEGVVRFIRVTDEVAYRMPLVDQYEFTVRLRKRAYQISLS